MGLAIAGLLSVATVSCKKDVSKIVDDGEWGITLFSEDGNNETSHFSGYVFTFDDNGTVTATRPSSTVSGTWSEGSDDSKEKLYLNFGTVDPFDELNEDWEILEKTKDKIRLEHISGGNGGTDLLTFEKS